MRGTDGSHGELPVRSCRARFGAIDALLQGCPRLSQDPIDADGWSFLTRDTLTVMLGECATERPASELGDHSYFAYWNDGTPDRSASLGRAQRLATAGFSRLPPPGSAANHARAENIAVNVNGSSRRNRPMGQSR